MKFFKLTSFINSLLIISLFMNVLIFLDDLDRKFVLRVLLDYFNFRIAKMLYNHFSLIVILYIIAYK